MSGLLRSPCPSAPLTHEGFKEEEDAKRDQPAVISRSGTCEVKVGRKKRKRKGSKKRQKTKKEGEVGLSYTAEKEVHVCLCKTTKSCFNKNTREPMCRTHHLVKCNVVFINQSKKKRDLIIPCQNAPFFLVHFKQVKRSSSYGNYLCPDLNSKTSFSALTFQTPTHRVCVCALQFDLQEDRYGQD